MKLEKRLFACFYAIAVGVLSIAVRADSVTDEAYVAQWAPALGSQAPLISAPDATGHIRTFEDLKTEHGLIMFFNRSADW